MPLTAPSLRVEPGRRDRLTHRRAGNEDRGIRQLSIFVMSPFSPVFVPVFSRFLRRYVPVFFVFFFPGHTTVVDIRYVPVFFSPFSFPRRTMSPFFSRFSPRATRKRQAGGESPIRVESVAKSGGTPPLREKEGCTSRRRGSSTPRPWRAASGQASLSSDCHRPQETLPVISQLRSCARSGSQLR